MKECSGRPLPKCLSNPSISNCWMCKNWRAKSLRGGLSCPSTRPETPHSIFSRPPDARRHLRACPQRRLHGPSAHRHLDIATKIGHRRRGQKSPRIGFEATLKFLSLSTPIRTVMMTMPGVKREKPHGHYRYHCHHPHLSLSLIGREICRIALDYREQ